MIENKVELINWRNEFFVFEHWFWSAGNEWNV